MCLQQIEQIILSHWNSQLVLGFATSCKGLPSTNPLSPISGSIFYDLIP